MSKEDERICVELNEKDVQEIVNCYEKDIKYIKQLEHRIEKAIEYIETIKDNTPSSTRKDFAKMILINYEQLLDILKGEE